MEKWWKLQEPQEQSPFAVMFQGEDKIPRRYVPGEGLVDWPSLVSYLFGGDLGAIPITRAEALRLIKAEVGRVSPANLAKGRGTAPTIQVPG